MNDIMTKIYAQPFHYSHNLVLNLIALRSSLHNLVVPPVRGGVRKGLTRFLLGLGSGGLLTFTWIKLHLTHVLVSIV